jgi:hypothetical protein
MVSTVQTWNPTVTVWSIFKTLSKNHRSRNSAVGIATGYGLDDRGVVVRVPAGSRIFSSPRRPVRLWGSPSLLSNGYWGLFPRGESGRGVTLTTHLQLAPRSRKRGSIHPLPHTSSWRSAYLVKHRDNFTSYKKSDYNVFGIAAKHGLLLCERSTICKYVTTHWSWKCIALRWSRWKTKKT